MVLGRPNDTNNKQPIANPGRNVVELKLLAKQKVIEDNEYGAYHSHKERLVGKITFSFPDAPNGIRQQTAAKGDEIRVNTGDTTPECR